MQRGEQHSPAGSAEHLRRMLQDHYYAPSGPPPGGAGVWNPLPHDIIRVQLTADWPPCQDGQAVEVELDPTTGKPVPTTRAVVLRDPLGTMLSSELFDEALFVMPKDTYVWVQATFDGSAPDDGKGPYYEPLAFGEDLCSGSGSGGGGGGSGSSGSGSACFNPFAGLDLPTITPVKVLGVDADDCLGWALVGPCTPSSGS